MIATHKTRILKSVPFRAVFIPFSLVCLDKSGNQGTIVMKCDDIIKTKTMYFIPAFQNRKKLDTMRATLFQN